MPNSKPSRRRQPTAPFTELELQFFAEGDELEERQEAVDDFSDLDDSSRGQRY